MKTILVILSLMVASLGLTMPGRTAPRKASPADWQSAYGTRSTLRTISHEPRSAVQIGMPSRDMAQRVAQPQPVRSFTGSVAVTGTLAYTRTDDLHDRRLDHTATLLSDGRVLIAGGITERFPFPYPVQSAEIYNPASGTYGTPISLVDHHSNHTATLLPNGDVLLVGGYDFSDPGSALQITRSVERFDALSNTFTRTASLTVARAGHSATLLADGRVLVAGGATAATEPETITATAEIYDPATGSWSMTGSMAKARVGHDAILLKTGKVLVVSDDSAELYDPITHSWRPAGTLAGYHHSVQLALLSNGSILVVGGSSTLVERYDPPTNTWKTVGSLRYERSKHTLTVLDDDQVLVIGSRWSSGMFYPEIYDPVSTSSRLAPIFTPARSAHTATRLGDGRVLVAGGDTGRGGGIALSQLVSYRPSNVFTATLKLPTDWVTTNTITGVVSATTSRTPLESVALGDGAWVPARAGQPATVTFTVADGFNVAVTLRLRDSRGLVGRLLSLGRVNVDSVPPSSAIQQLPEYASNPIHITWSGSDATSRIAHYDVQVREGAGGTWTPIVSATTSTTTTFQGSHGRTYFFRVRATDRAGNQELWAEPYDTATTVDLVAPTGGIGIVARGPDSVLAGLTAADNTSGVAEMRVALADAFDQALWEAFATTKSIALNGLPPSQARIYAEFRDRAGNVSQRYCIRANGRPCSGTSIYLPLVRH